MNITDKQWQEYLDKTSHINRHYAATPKQQRVMCDIIRTLPKGANVVELGTCYGSTSALIMLACPDINFTTIDHFKMENNYELTKPQLDALNVPYTLIKGDTQSVAWDKPIDFLFIDAGHDEANVKPDIEKWVPFVKKGGYVAFHDWDGAKEASLSPHWAITYYGDLATGGWKEVAYIEDQLMIRQNI